MKAYLPEEVKKLRDQYNFPSNFPQVGTDFKNDPDDQDSDTEV